MGCFLCTNNKQCLPDDWVCDGINHCYGEADDDAKCSGDGKGTQTETDETGSSCETYEWQCSDGTKCVQLTDMCDGKPQCGDASDEVEANCPDLTCDAKNEWQCDNKKQCIQKGHRCDNIEEDCRDNSDEANCPGKRASAKRLSNKTRKALK